MLLRVDHVDIRVSNLEEAETFFSGLGLIVVRRLDAPRNSIEMALPGRDQVVFEIKPVKEGGQTGIAHIGFAMDDDCGEILNNSALTFTCKERYVPATGRTVSNLTGFDQSVWQLTRSNSAGDEG